MGWFKRNRKSAGDSSLDRVAERIAGRILVWQSSLSAKLNSVAKRMDQRVLLALFVIVGLMFFGYCLWLVSSLFR
jgi:hypothetical protein